MSIRFSGTIKRSGGSMMSAVVEQIKRVNLAPLDKIDVRFDPFDRQSRQARDFLFYVSAPKIRATNPQCSLKTEIVCDRSEPTITFSLQSGEKVVLKTALLTSLNILKLYNKHITSLIPPDPAELEAKKLLEEEKSKKKKRPHHKIKLWSKHRGVFHLI
ncbi:PREDICTED: 39S ribosomal protein L53, mitochondrial [Trachymyrmex cornetzi]|uniref:Large ribosomal subunit protein mL53 n=1 Tax=Trachymyrmex cornetzi TaxID=471704 RepID=A0A195DEJ9_9HYME|nr:PREDICTED: 39S ribosomal protein L53, mitochondrial [Trachymyrmex cornetzi]KYN11318.1 39S ribosomal protein L53, mitochondrial [Trachymyrmex cornetzi]